MIHSLLLKKTYEPIIIQAPLAGVSCAPFRKLAWQHGDLTYTCTEMISCKTLIHAPAAKQKRYITIDPEEGPVCFQLSGNHPNEIAHATKIATDLGASIIDLNCGCPVNKIRKKGAGSKLLSQTENLFHLITAMKSNTHLPVSVKIRVQSTFSDYQNNEIAKIIRDAGADILIVHGRHWTEHYETAVHYEQIAYFAHELTIPVIGNGDVACLISYKKMLNTGCDGVMIGRASVGQPWLSKQLQHEFKGKLFQRPSIKEIGLILLRHTEDLITLIGNEKFALLQMRQFAKYYARHIPNKALAINAIHQVETFDEFKQLLKNYWV